MNRTASDPVDSSTPEPATAPDASIAKGLFLGRVAHDRLLPYPSLDARELEVVVPMVDALDRFLAERVDRFREWDRTGAQPPEFIEELRELGAFGLIVPEEHGGFGFSNAAYARLLSHVSRYDSSATLTIGAHSSIGMKGLLLFGTASQRERYLPRLATGELIAAFCLTEPGAGSDAASLRTTAKRLPDGSWSLNGSKLWITNGGIAGLYTVFARTDEGGGRISAFVVEAAWPGVGRGAHEDKMGIRASSTAAVTFDDVRVPAENLLGEVGKGFKIAMAILNSGRTGLGGGAVGGMKTLLAHATRHAQERRQFDRPIAGFEIVRTKLAQMALDCFAAESTVWMVANLIDSGADDYSVEAAISKVYASDALTRASYDALQIAGGLGFMRDAPYEQIARDARILPIFEGTNEILRLFVAMSGLKEAGRELSEVRAALDEMLNHPIKGFGVLGSYAERRFAQATGRSTSRAATPLPRELRDDSVAYERYAGALASTAEAVLRRHGKAVVDRQLELVRLADVAIDLFVGLCTLSRAATLGVQQPERAAHVHAFARTFASQARRRMAANLRRLERGEDAELATLAAATLADGGYAFDVI